MNGDSWALATDQSLLGGAGPIDPGAGTVFAPTTPSVDPPPVDPFGISAVNLPGGGSTIYSAPIGPTIPAYPTVSAGSVTGGANTSLPGPTPPPIPGVSSGYGGVLDQFIRSTQAAAGRAVTGAYQQTGSVLITSIPGLSIGRNQVRPVSVASGLGGGIGSVFALALVGVILYAVVRR